MSAVDAPSDQVNSSNQDHYTRWLNQERYSGRIGQLAAWRAQPSALARREWAAMAPVEGPWWLVTQLPPLQPGSKLDVKVLRRLTEDEQRRVRQANTLLRRLHGASVYGQMVSLFQELRQATERDMSPDRQAAEMNRAAHALSSTAAEIAADLRLHAHADFGVESAEIAALEVAINEETQQAPFQILLAVRELTQGPFIAVESGVVNNTAAVGQLQMRISNVANTIDLASAIRSGIVVAQRLIGRQLLIYEGRISEASLCLRQLAAEISDGAPALMCSSSYDPAHGEMRLGRVTFDPLALTEAVELHRALRRTAVLLQETGDARPQSLPVGSQDKTEGQGQSGGDHATRTAGNGPSRERSTPDLQCDRRQDQVFDLRSLATYATVLTGELEQAWTAALEAGLLSETLREIDARLQSLLRAFQRRATAGDRAADAAGIDPGLPPMPLPADEVARLSFDPNKERHWRQLQLAEVEAIVPLLEAIKAMREPSVHRVYGDQRRMESWWEAGAFMLVRERTALLVRLAEHLEAAEAQVTGESTNVVSTPAFVDHLRMAWKALGLGQIEASLLYARMALYLRARLESDGVPADLLERLSDASGLADEASLLRLLDEAVRKLAAGEAPDLGASMLVASRVVVVVERICLRQPQVLAAALGQGGSRDGG